MTLPRNEIAALIPHAGRMCLLDSVSIWTARDISCGSASHRDTDNPLRLGDVLPVLAGIEYAAQAMALHGRLTAPDDGAPRMGFIGSLREIAWSVPRLDDIEAPLLIEAERQAGDLRSALYRFRVCAEGQTLLSGRAAVLLGERPPA